MIRERTVLVAAAAFVASLLSASLVEAAFTTPSCLASKRKAWGDLRKCEAAEGAKALKGKASDAAKCRTKFGAKLVKLDAKATKAAIATVVELLVLNAEEQAQAPHIPAIFGPTVSGTYWSGTPGASTQALGAAFDLPGVVVGALRTVEASVRAVRTAL